MFSSRNFVILRYILLSMIATHLEVTVLESRMFFPRFCFLRFFHKSRITVKLLDQVDSRIELHNPVIPGAELLQQVDILQTVVLSLTDPV